MGFYLSRRWHAIRTVWILFALEFANTIPCLVLFAIAQPNTYRTKLRQDGFNNGFNSSPNDPIFAMVNQVSYTNPVVWSQHITDYNVVISVLSMFLMLVKAIMWLMHIFYPIMGVVVHGALVGLWGYSLWAQASPDHSNPEYSSLHAPWYIQKSCSVVHDPANEHYCNQAKGALAVTVVMLTLFIANTAIAIWSLYPTKAQRFARRSKLDMAEAEDRASLRFQPPPETSQKRMYELQASKMPPSPGYPGMRSPATPRSKAFSALGGVRDLPLRQA